MISLSPHKQPTPPQQLGELIQRIIAERGSFTNLTEETLETDVEAPIEESDENHFQQLRQQLDMKVSLALNESALNLDFVSLLVSALRPQAGESSMSQLLRSQVPIGSFNADTVTNLNKTLDNKAGYAWKLNAYNLSKSHLMESHASLLTKTRLERKFFHDMLYLVMNGEVVNKKLQVTYGFADSGSTLPVTGVLSKNQLNGSAQFKPQTKLSKELVQVSVFGDGNSLTSNETTPEPERLIGRACIPFELDAEEPLLSVKLARNFLFEHELMQQIILETRTRLASHGVVLENGDKVVCQFFGLRIEIELVDAEQVKKGTFGFADAVNYSLHLLLIKHFNANLNLRHSRPPPLKTTKPKQETPKVLSTVLAHIQHSILVQRALKLVQVMLPNRPVELKRESGLRLESEPFSRIVIGDLELEVRAPITMGGKAPIIGKMNGVETRVFDLTELEMWLKYA